jgi:hypothetical protein
MNEKPNDVLKRNLKFIKALEHTAREYGASEMAIRTYTSTLLMSLSLNGLITDYKSLTQH